MIIFSKHALKRIREREIQRKDITKIIKNPDHIQRDNGRIIVTKKLNHKTLEIVFVKEYNKIIILTCYYLL